MKLDGSFSIGASTATVWNAIRDPALMAQCVPGCETAEALGEDRYRAVVGAKIGPIKARFNLVIEVEEEVAPTRIRSKASGEEGSRASMLTSRNLLTLSEVTPDVTEVLWHADVSITGRLGKYGLGLIKKRVKALSDQFVANFTKRIEEGVAMS
jgi:carbon monoxide dehydrogenase subunit G